MQIYDRVHGDIEITNPVIVDLINSHPMQRLKRISQDGAAHFLQPVRNVTRFEHSVGVWYLSYIYKRPIEEQIACLLHDTPHTAFSHVIDFVLDDESYTFHEKFTKQIIMDSEIPDILKKYNIDLEKVLNTKNFPLLENDLPNLSVDRWDYFMRDGYNIGYLPKLLAKKFIADVSIDKKSTQFYFNNKRLGATFAVLFTSFSRLLWLGPNSHASYILLASAIKKAYDLKFITQDDFFTDDDTLFRKLKNTNNQEINELLTKLTPSTTFEYATLDDAELINKNKPRSVDPLVMHKNKLVKVSTLLPNLEYFFREFKEKYSEIGVKEV